MDHVNLNKISFKTPIKQEKHMKLQDSKNRKNYKCKPGPYLIRALA